VPFNTPHEYVKEFKQSPRREDDIAIVNAGMRMALEKVCLLLGGERSSVWNSFVMYWVAMWCIAMGWDGMEWNGMCDAN
jgi:hypothetical protein